MYLTSDLEIYSASYGLDSTLLCEQPTFELKSRVCAGRGSLPPGARDRGSLPPGARDGARQPLCRAGDGDD